MTQVVKNGAATQKGSIRGSTKAAKALTIAQCAELVENAAGSLWNARISLGKAINTALVNGHTLLALQDELKAHADKYGRTHKVVSLNDKNASPLSKLATVARVIGEGIKSPDEKHTVSAEQVAAWDLSAEDAYALAGRVAREKINVKTLLTADRKKVLQLLDSTKTERKGDANAKSKKVFVPENLYKKLEAKLKSERESSGNKDLSMADIITALLG